MPSMTTIAKGVGGLVGVLAVVAGGGFLWAKSASGARLSRHYETHRVDFPLPFPLSETELAELRAERSATTLASTDPAAAAAAAPTSKAEGDAAGSAAPDPLAGVDLDAIARERAVARGKHLVESRFVCIECHGKDFGGGTMIDAPPIGKIYGRNITLGKGSVTTKYTAADWDRIVRHGVKPDGSPAAMPSTDFFEMSDHELSDIVMYVRSMPPVDKDVPPPTLGPVGTFLVANGEIRLSAEERKDHNAAHAAEPPPTGDTAEFGKHLVQICTGCHGAELAGGPIAGGDPSWPPARNITPHADGLSGWSYEDFERTLRTGKRKNGETLQQPMAGMVGYAQAMSDTELHAMWAYLQTVPPKASQK